MMLGSIFTWLAFGALVAVLTLLIILVASAIVNGLEKAFNTPIRKRK